MYSMVPGVSLKSLVGLDLSLTSTGVSIAGETFVISTKFREAERLSFISTTILDLCLERKISCAIIESYAFASRVSRAHSIGELGGCVRMKLWENDIKYVDVPPTCRAKFATGKGNSSKNDVMSAISAKTGIVFAGSGSDDMCDAWILEQMGLAHLGLSQYTWPEVNMSTLQTIDWSPLEGINELPQ